jgi:hypothetical protein
MPSLNLLWLLRLWKHDLSQQVMLTFVLHQKRRNSILHLPAKINKRGREQT